MDLSFKVAITVSNYSVYIKNLISYKKGTIQ